MNTVKPYSKKDYKEAKDMGLDLDNWDDYQDFYELGQKGMDEL